jgi:hypothetical protein
MHQLRKKSHVFNRPANVQQRPDAQLGANPARKQPIADSE